MRNYIQSGETVDVVAPVPVASGQFVIVGTIQGVATTSAPVGGNFALRRRGIEELAKNQNEAWTAGASIYFDSSTGLATTATANAASAANALVGRAAEPIGSPSAVGRVLLSDFVGV